MRKLVVIAIGMLAGVFQAGWGLAGEAEPAPSGRVEVVLAIEHRAHLEEITRDFAEAGLANLHIQFMKAGHPPANLGLGADVSVARAQAAIKLARKYNGGIVVLLPERLFPRQYITIASSGFDDTVEYPVSAEALRTLEDPSLSTSQFHDLYRRLTPADQPPAKKGRVF